jgi:SAM-dependent methyltransferase
MDDRVAFWRRWDAMEARLTRPVSERMLDLAGVGAGMRVLDVAAGRGEPAIPAARRVGAGGSVLAIESTEGFLEIARERARAERVTNVTWRVGDAESFNLTGPLFHAATVRWALMYMGAPERALSCVHRALAPGGALVTASWAEAERVAFMSLPRRILARHRDVPPYPDGPGIFRDADRATFDAMLERKGFSVEASEEMEIAVVEAPDARGVMTWIVELGGPLMTLVREMPPAVQRAWQDEVCAVIERTRDGETVRLTGVTRLTLARAARAGA